MAGQLLNRWSTATAALAFGLIAAGCSSSTVGAPSAVTASQQSAPVTNAGPPATAPDLACDAAGATAGTDVDPSGNRLFDATVDLGVTPTDVELGAEPMWVLPIGPAGSWYVALADGSALTVSAEGSVSPATALPAGEPPQLRSTGDTQGIESAYVLQPLFDDPLPDTRVVTEGPLAAALVGPTDRYQHGIAGDVIEASAVEVLHRCTGERTRIEIEAPSVIEGISPMLADVDGDAMVDVIVTTSNRDVGARVEAYRVDGTLLGKSEPIGQGNRWRNQLGVLPLGPDGVPELVDVRVPHINGVVEFFQLDGDELVIVADITGYTSHVLGSRNLDQGILGDATGDGRPEVILLNQDRTRLAVLERTDEGVEVVAEVDVGGRGVTNIAVQDLGQGAALAVGTSSATLRIWAP
jgi:hypothetical protein